MNGDAWTALLPLALVGTERHAGALPAWPGAFGAAVAQALQSAEQRGSGVLRAAALVATCEHAGALGHEWMLPLPAPAPADARPALSERTLLLQAEWALREGPPRLLHQFCAALDRTGWVLPPPLLPGALEAGRRSVALRPLLARVLGERGLWLAAQRDEWRYGVGVSTLADDEARWNEGSLEQRHEFLAREREREPAHARERLAAALAELPAKERAEFIALLSRGLGPDDEALLDSLRADRSREVRQAALDLLLRLPDAAHPQRAAARLAALLTQERGLLRKRWVIDAPAAAQADWKDDNLDAPRPKQESLGERAWWLYQCVRQVPLSWWTKHTGLSAAELQDWAQGSEWTEAIQRAWRDVLFAAPESAWCEAFIDAWPKAWSPNERGAVLALLPLAQRERHWKGQLHGADALGHLLPQILPACPPLERLSKGLSMALADALRERIAARALTQDWTMRSQAGELACALHPDALPALRDLPRAADETPAEAEALHTLAQIVAMRLALQSLPHRATPTP